MSKKSYNAVMKELKAIKKELDKKASKVKFQAMKENAKNERAADNLARDKQPFDLYYAEDKFNPSLELGYDQKPGFSDTY
jgi:hypothetical protein|tara:strand:- start:477 stop:716 length:240 start_codon:yes stop_codon:yes gene_type:complete